MKRSSRTNAFLRFGLNKFMRAVFRDLLLLGVFSVVFSSFSACTGTSGNSATGEVPVNNASAESKAETKAESTYPPLPSALAESKFELLDGTSATLNDR
jgi:hypothetical protein